ncbi:CE1759 family FMN reductase [Gulosibacter bifidus]|uniref:CE1759 family FMN reductase n=1 Tax=Gulosibacter bifidus TaxID=272239 RepID=A0ABW5RI35_9MICO|nr:CE1759 family FMN reductase [Gulosibacter bifidus]
MITDQQPTTASTPSTVRLVVISAGTGTPSSTRMVADQIATATARFAQDAGSAVQVHSVELREMAADIVSTMSTGVLSESLETLTKFLHEADGVIVSSPVFKAKANGLFSLFVQVLERDLFIAKPVVLAATAGTKRHTLVVDSDMRTQFAYLRALVTPTSVFAASEDLNTEELEQRIQRAAAELWVLIRSGAGPQMRALSEGNYKTDFGSTAQQGHAIDFDTDLMRLATGGSLAE